MKTEIEIGRRPEVFWATAANMAAEHAGYYARENGFRNNFRMFQSMADCYNARIGQCAIQHTIMLGGGTREVRQAVAELLVDSAELAALDNTMSSFGQLSSPLTGGGDPGASMQFSKSLAEISWTTSAGNILAIRLEGEWVTILVDGRRHGIPWRFAAPFLSAEELLVLAQESQATAKPWQDGQGETLAKFAGEDPRNFAAPCEPLPCEWPEWGNAHQQAGWVADIVHRWNMAASFFAVCAAHALPLGAVSYERASYIGPFEISEAEWRINWRSSPELFRRKIRSQMRPAPELDNRENWRSFLSYLFSRVFPALPSWYTTYAEEMPATRGQRTALARQLLDGILAQLERTNAPEPASAGEKQ